MSGGQQSDMTQQNLVLKHKKVIKVIYDSYEKPNITKQNRMVIKLDNVATKGVNYQALGKW